MKKYLFAIALIFLLSVHAGAQQSYEMSEGSAIMITEALTLTADAAAVALPSNLSGGYLYAVEINSTADDAMTFSISSALGTTLFTRTTSGAIAGEIAHPSGYWPIPRGTTATYTLAGLGAGSVTIYVTVVKK